MSVRIDLAAQLIDGKVLSQAVRERNNDIPLAVITGWGEAVGSHERKAARVDWVVAKPFDTLHIIEIAQEVFRRREGSHESVNAIVAA